MASQSKTLMQRHDEQKPVEAEVMQEEKPVFRPATDVYEMDDHFMMIADMPGVDEKSLSINLEGDSLTINGQVPRDSMPGYDLIRQEYETGDFRRTFTLSHQIDREHLEAVLKAGVLRLRLPKVESAKVRKIPVKTE